MRKIFLFIFIALTGCLPSELDNLQSFEYRFDELEVVEPLVDIEFSEPPEVPREPGGVEVSGETDLLVRDVVQAVVDEDIDDTNITIIEQFAEVAPEVPTQLLIDEVTNDWIVGVFNGTVTPSEELILLNDEFEKIEEFLPYFSQLRFPNIDGIEFRGRRQNLERNFNLLDLVVLNKSQDVMSLVTPCKEAAEVLYVANLEELNRQAESQIADARTFYASLITFYETEYVDNLNAQGDELYDEYLRDFEEFAIVFNTAIENLNYPEIIVRGLKAYLASYVIQSINDLNEWFSIYLTSIDAAKEGNISRLENELNSVLEVIDRNLNEAIARQTTLFNNAVNNCHDQGFGG